MKIAAVPILLLNGLDGTSDFCTLPQLYKLFENINSHLVELVINIIFIVYFEDNAELHWCHLNNTIIFNESTS